MSGKRACVFPVLVGADQCLIGPSGDARLPAPAEKRAVTSQVAQAGGRFIRDAVTC
jgi:hypothetical protein